MRSTRQKMIHFLGFGLIALGVFRLAFVILRPFPGSDIKLAESVVVATASDHPLFAQTIRTDTQPPDRDRQADRSYQYSLQENTGTNRRPSERRRVKNRSTPPTARR